MMFKVVISYISQMHLETNINVSVEMGMHIKLPSTLFSSLLFLSLLFLDILCLLLSIDSGVMAGNGAKREREQLSTKVPGCM